MAKRNGVQEVDGKSLADWQEEVNQFCKDFSSRRCVQISAQIAHRHRENIWNLLLNYRCYVARWATSKFFDSEGPDDKVYNNHKKAVEDAWKAVEDCVRFLEQEFKRLENAATKEANRARHAEEMKRAQANRAKRPKIGPQVLSLVGLDVDVDMDPGAALQLLQKIKKVHT